MQEPNKSTYFVIAPLSTINLSIAECVRYINLRTIRHQITELNIRQRQKMLLLLYLQYARNRRLTKLKHFVTYLVFD
jgi:hypothetical protein